MSCDVCSNFSCPGLESGVLHTTITLPLPRCYKTCLYVPCYCRQQVTSSINHWKQEAFQEQGKQRNLVLITNEDLSYEIYITDEPHRSKIHRPGWEKLMSNYDLRYRDLIIINLDTGSLSIEIDLRLSESRGGHKPLPKPSLALDYINASEKEYIGNTVYGLGINLSFRQMGELIYFVFDADEFPSVPFVHRLNVTNIINGRLRIPTSVVRRLKLNLGYLPEKGAIILSQLYDAIDMITTYSIQTDGRMQVNEFSDFACEAQLWVGSTVLITIEKCWPSLGNMKLLRLIINDLS